MGPVGSNKGPWLVLDPMEVKSCVPRVPWHIFYCLECKTIANTADFRGMMIAPPPGINCFENTPGLLGLKEVICLPKDSKI